MKLLGIPEDITIHPENDMNVCTRFHGNPSHSLRCLAHNQTCQPHNVCRLHPPCPVVAEIG